MVTGVELLVGAGAAACKGALKKSIDALYDAVTGPSKRVLRSLRTARQINNLHGHLGRVRRVKTLGQLDRAVDLITFYCDSHIYIGNKRKRIRSLLDLGSDDNLLIEGIAGQGKSIFLRYLTTAEAARGYFVPIFAELRKIQDKQTLEDFLIKALQGYHIDAEPAVLTDLADSGRLLLLLDAFDEIRDDAKTVMLEQLQDFAAEHPKLRIIVTSRPESGLEVSALFCVVKLSNLEGEEYADVINKITQDAELAGRLIKQVQHHHGGIRALLQTPLLVTLLVIRFKSYQELPEQLADFYDSLFQVLLQRHDGIKPGYRRPRGCSLNDFQYRQVFESFCYFSKRTRERLRQADVHKFAEAALEDRHLGDNAQKFVDDIVKITCLLVRDGEEYRFIHKSVQEYYAASFLRQKSDRAIEQIYGQLFDRKSFYHFDQELRFLAEMDQYRFQKFGLLPFLASFFAIPVSDLSKKPTEPHIQAVGDRLKMLKVAVVLHESIAYVRSIQLPTFGPKLLRATAPFENMINTVVVPWAHAIKPGEGEDKVLQLMPALSLLDPKSPWESKVRTTSVEITNRLFRLGMDALKHVELEESRSTELPSPID